MEPVGTFPDFGDLSAEDVARVIQEHQQHGYKKFYIDLAGMKGASLLSLGFLEFVRQTLSGLGLLTEAGVASARFVIAQRFDHTVPAGEMMRRLWNDRAHDWAVLESPASYSLTFQTLMEFLRVNSRATHETFLSIGSGPGLYETYLGGMFQGMTKPEITVHCLDAANEMTNCHRSILFRAHTASGKTIENVKPLTGDMQKLPFSAGSVDQIICINALQWAMDWRMAITEMERVLRPEGLGWLYLFIFPHPMSVFSATGERMLEVGKFDLHELFDELERHRFVIYHCRHLAGREGMGMAGLPLRRVFVKARFQATGERSSWRTAKVSTALTGVKAEE